MNDKEIRSIVSIHKGIPLFDSDGAGWCNAIFVS